MTSLQTSDLLEVLNLEGVTVVRFLRRTILDPMLIEAVGERLSETLAGVIAPRVLINFTKVESVTSAMMGRLVGLHQSIVENDGKLVFCGVGPFLQQLFAVCQLPAIVMYPDEETALLALRA